MVLPSSRKKPVAWARNKDLLSWLACHTARFERLGGVPAAVRVDHEKTAVVRGVAGVRPGRDPSLTALGLRSARGYFPTHRLGLAASRLAPQFRMFCLLKEATARLFGRRFTRAMAVPLKACVGQTVTWSWHVRLLQSRLQVVYLTAGVGVGPVVAVPETPFKVSSCSLIPFPRFAFVDPD